MFRPTGQEIGGAVCALLGFMVHFGSSTSRAVNGVVVESSQTDYGRILFGILAVVLAGFAATSSSRSRIVPTGSMGLHKALAAAIACVGAYHLAVGFGLV